MYYMFRLFSEAITWRSFKNTENEGTLFTKYQCLREGWELLTDIHVELFYILAETVLNLKYLIVRLVAC